MIADTCIEWVIPATESKGWSRNVYIIKEWDGNIYKSYNPEYKSLIKGIFINPEEK